MAAVVAPGTMPTPAVAVAIPVVAVVTTAPEVAVARLMPVPTKQEQWAIKETAATDGSQLRPFDKRIGSGAGGVNRA